MRSSGPQEIQPYYFWKRWCNLFDEISQESKADLPILKLLYTSIIKKTVKDTVKSMAGRTDNPVPEETELMRTKQDLIIEKAEIVAYGKQLQLFFHVIRLNMGMSILCIQIIRQHSRQSSGVDVLCCAPSNYEFLGSH